MNSFPVEARPAAAPRQAAAALLLHGGVAVLPWLGHWPWPQALAVGLVALAGLPATLAWVPGPQARLVALRCRDGVWQALRRGQAGWEVAVPTRRCRVFPGLLLVALRVGGHELGWLLGRRDLPADEFRRLKARLRLAC